MRFQPAVRKLLSWIPFLQVWPGERLTDIFMAKSKGLKLDKLSQIATVVKDLNHTVDYYRSTFGIGPWRKNELSIEDCVDRGRLTDLRCRVAVAYPGSVQLELIEVLEGDTILLAYPGNRDEGLHHLGFVVKDLDEKITACKREGITILQQGTVTSMGLKSDYAFLDLTARCGLIIELIQQSFLGRGIGGHPHLLRFATRVLGD